MNIILWRKSNLKKAEKLIKEKIIRYEQSPLKWTKEDLIHSFLHMSDEEFENVLNIPDEEFENQIDYYGQPINYAPKPKNKFPSNASLEEQIKYFNKNCVRKPVKFDRIVSKKKT